jgi:acetyl-CoA carboxylase biotin carboxyl carrier protein
MDFTNEDVADILALLDSLPYDELDLQTSKFRLTLRRAATGGWTQEGQFTAGPQSVENPGLRTEAASGASEHQRGSGAGPGMDDGAGSIPVTTALPGTFYRAPRPGAAPFTEVGALVTEDTVVAIVETMKLMNPVHAGARGRIAAILARNAQAVAQGAVLMRIDPEDEREAQ